MMRLQRRKSPSNATCLRIGYESDTNRTRIGHGSDADRSEWCVYEEVGGWGGWRGDYAKLLGSS